MTDTPELLDAHFGPGPAGPHTKSEVVRSLGVNDFDWAQIVKAVLTTTLSDQRVHCIGIKAATGQALVAKGRFISAPNDQEILVNYNIDLPDQTPMAISMMLIHTIIIWRKAAPPDYKALWEETQNKLNQMVEAYNDGAQARDEAGFVGTVGQCIRYLDGELTAQRAHHGNMPITPTYTLSEAINPDDMRSPLTMMRREVVAIKWLTDLALAVSLALERVVPSYSVEDGPDGRLKSTDDPTGYIIDLEHHERLLQALDGLELLPDDHPTYLLGPASKARWTLRRLLKLNPHTFLSEALNETADPTDRHPSGDRSDRPHPQQGTGGQPPAQGGEGTGGVDNPIDGGDFGPGLLADPSAP